MASMPCDRLRRIEQRGFARARAAAAHVDRGHGRLVENDGGRAGAEAEVLGMADFEAGNVGDEIAHEAFPSFRGAPIGASPESIITGSTELTLKFPSAAGGMDFALAACAAPE